MAHFAKVENGIVTNVTVAEQSFIDSGAVGDPTLWIQTSYNTHEGKHSNKGTPLRKNYAARGFKYDKIRDAFIPPQPYPSWKLNEQSCVYEPPTPQPKDSNHIYDWNEQTKTWDQVI